MKASSSLTLLPSNTLEVENFFLAIKNEVLNKGVNPLELLINLECLKKVTENFRKDAEIMDVIFQMLDTNNGKIQVNGSEIKTRKNSDYRYFDNELFFMEKQANSLDEKIKERKKFLQNLQEPVIIETTGEVIEPAQNIPKPDSVVITLKKT